jgi:hypothetical protein
MPHGHAAKSSADEQTVAFIVRVATAALEDYRDGDYLNLAEDLAAFARNRELPLELHPTDSLPNMPPSHEGLRRLQRLREDFAELLHAAAAPQSTFPAGSRASKYYKPESVGTSLTGHGISIRHGGASMVVSGPYLGLLSYKAALLLLFAKTPAVSRLRMCPECCTVFLRVRKQQYCSRVCVNKANMRAWLKTPKGKASQRASSRRTYEKRVRGRHPLAKIRTNQKRTK